MTRLERGTGRSILRKMTHLKQKMTYFNKHMYFRRPVGIRDDSGGRSIDRKNQENPENSLKIAKNGLNLTNFVLFEASKNRKS